MRSLQKHLSIIVFLFFFILSLVNVPVANAAGPTGFEDLAKVLLKNKSLQDYGKEFCDKRTGELMNLETWFSGKCGKEVDTLSGDGVGFVDIITLQGIETLIGSQQEGLLDQIIGFVKKIDLMKSLLGANPHMPINERVAMIQSLSPNSGLLSTAAKTIASVINTKPASSYDYIAYVSNNLKNKHIVKDALAASPGFGFTSLSPILPIWRAFRNISYTLFAFVFIMYGMMIMFRIKIDSKTAATISLAIPKIVVTLLVITFSYAIVGLLIDISTVITGLSINVLALGGILNLNAWSDNLVIPIINGTSWLGAIGSLALNSLIAMMVAPLIVMSFIFGPFAGITGFVVGIIGFANGLGLVVGVIIFIAILISYIKLILKLFQAFLSIIINLIFAPIILLGNVLPGSKAISTWIMGIVGNLAVFPVAVFFLTLSYALMVQPFFGIVRVLAQVGGLAAIPAELTSDFLGVADLSTSGVIWAPPMTFSVGIGGGIGTPGDIMLATIGFGLLLMASKYVDMVADALKTPPFKYGSAIGEALKFGVKGNETMSQRGYDFMPNIAGAQRRASLAYGPTPGSAPGTASTINQTSAANGGINAQSVVNNVPNP